MASNINRVYSKQQQDKWSDRTTCVCVCMCACVPVLTVGDDESLEQGLRTVNRTSGRWYMEWHTECVHDSSGWLRFIIRYILFH